MGRLWNDGWTFYKTPVGTSREQALTNIEKFESVKLPHDWLIYDSRNLYEDGTGWYRKVFEAPKEKEGRVFLYFEGIYMDSAVYVNGQKAFEWKYGYSSFEVEITDYLKNGANEVMVSACFRNPNSRWYSGAGIYRDVWIETTPAVYLPRNSTYITTRKTGEDFVLHIETEVAGPGGAAGENTAGGRTEEWCERGREGQGEEQNDGQSDGQNEGQGIKVTYRLLDEQGMETAMRPLSEDGTSHEYLVKQPLLWDVVNPVLYHLEISLWLGERLIQQQKERFGFRYVEFDSQKGFFLNGRPLKLNGVCEHHDLGALGAAFNRSAMKRKFMKLKEMGVNAVRGTHNMMAPGFVELADEMGLLMISEAFDMWEREKTTYDYARFFAEWSAKDVESWVKRDRNHPSVIMWSIGNEIYDTHADARGQELTRYLKKLVEQYDPAQNARVTIGSNYMPWENAQKCADIVKLAGYNYSEKYYKQQHEKYPDWVIYGSETSSIVQSRGVYHFPLRAGILSDEDEQCSALGNSTTSWGAKSMEDCIASDRDMEFSMGQFLWTGFDYIGEPTPYHTKNSYFGQLDTAGFPKDSYFVWQSAWTDYHKVPMVHVFPYWDFNPGQCIDVRVCSNAPLVELFLNGKSLGKQELTHEAGSGKRLLADYQVLYQEGTLTAVAYDENGREIARQERCSFGNSKRIVLTPENRQVQADGLDLWFVEISTADEKGNPVENAADRVCVEVDGAGVLVGLDNGDSTDYDSYKSSSRRLFNGKLLAIVQADTKPGDIVLTVTGKGLEKASVSCTCMETKYEEARYEGTENQRIENEDNKNEDSKNEDNKNEGNKNKETAHGLENDEIPVRKITLHAKQGQIFTPERRQLSVEAVIEPEHATDREVTFAVVNGQGVKSHLVKLHQSGHQAELEALGDGKFYLRCLSKSGTDKVRIISQLEFKIQGLGTAYLNPYDFIAGSQYTSVQGEVGNGNEKGVATARDGETVVSYANIDFGEFGSDEITIPIFALNDEACPIQIWEGIPGEEESERIADVIYQRESIWNVYQPETYKLKKRMKGITTVSFVVRQKLHIKGFSFTRLYKAWSQLWAESADAIYGDSYCKDEHCVKTIGNNVSLVFKNMDFGEKKMYKLTVKGRAAKSDNTIHVRFFDGTEEKKQIVEFAQSKEWDVQSFEMEPLSGKWDVTFVFLPGSCFDFEWFLFEGK